MTISEAIEKGNIMLKGENIDSPKLKARMLMQYILNKPRQFIIVNDKTNINKTQEQKYFSCINKLKEGIPIEHITNVKEFMKMNFFVDNNVLIPRQDTECLVEEVIKISNTIGAKNILDLCTGSGAIAVSLAKMIEDSKVTALDISKKALDVAKFNSKNNCVEEKIIFIQSNLFDNLPKEKYDIIVSNPPYIRTEEIKQLDIEVQKEPILALDGGYDGLDFYRKIIENAYQYLKYNGYLCLEIGYDQKIDVIELLENQGNYTDIYCKKDLYGNDRVIVAKVGV